MLSENVLALLNKQIAKEAYSSNLYLSMSAWCQHHGFTGAGEFLFYHAQEETLHMHKLFNYVLETGGLAEVDGLSRPPQQHDNILDLFQKILLHERSITKSINEIVDACFQEKDFATFNFLQWFVAEQHEEESLIQGIVDKINIIGTQGQGLFMIDKEISIMASRHGQNPDASTAAS